MFFYALILQVTKQYFGVILYICCCVSEKDVCIVAKAHDSSTFDVVWEVVTKPKVFGLWVRPSAYGATIEAVDSNNTGENENLLVT